MTERLWPFKELARFLRYEDPEVRFWAADRMVRHYPEEATAPLLAHLRHKMAQHILPTRRLRINRREVKQIYNKYQPKKRQLPPPAPFDPDDQFLDCVDLLDPLALELAVGGP